MSNRRLHNRFDPIKFLMCGVCHHQKRFTSSLLDKKEIQFQCTQQPNTNNGFSHSPLPTRQNFKNIEIKYPIVSGY